MERGKFKWDGEKLVPVEKAETVQTHNIITDEMPPTQSMADCKIYTSKALLRRHYREAGMIEVGNDVDGFKKTNPFETREYEEQLKEDLARSWYECRDKMAEVSELDRERCKRIDRQNKRYGYDRRERDRDGRPRE